MGKALFLIALLIPGMAIAKSVTVTWQDAPTTDCGGDSVASGFYTGIEIWIDSVPIPSVNEDQGGNGQCTPENGTDDLPPSGATLIVGTFDGSNSASFNLAPGTYFLRVRFNSVEGPSNFSNQITRTVPAGQPRTPFLIDLTF